MMEEATDFFFKSALWHISE